jgi:hypothetical protein
MIDSATGKSNGVFLVAAESAAKKPREKFLDTAEIEKLPPEVIVAPVAHSPSSSGSDSGSFGPSKRVSSLKARSASSSYNSSGSDSSGSGHSGAPKPSKAAPSSVVAAPKVRSSFDSGSSKKVPPPRANLSKWSSSSDSSSPQKVPSPRANPPKGSLSSSSTPPPAVAVPKVRSHSGSYSSGSGSSGPPKKVGSTHHSYSSSDVD